MKKIVAVMFGGQSSEHEVSVITGLQALEHIDRDTFDPIIIYVDKQGCPLLLQKIENRKQFLNAKRESVAFGRDEKGGLLRIEGMLGKKIYPSAAYLCFHGGVGESGPMEGLLESIGIAHTGPSQESAAITMNKAIAKTLSQEAGVPVAAGETLHARDVGEKSEQLAQQIIQKIGLPVIVKPAHLGSSIGISIAKTEIELEKALIESAHMDSEIVVEKFLSPIIEYNCAVRRINGKLETSEIERLLSKDEILSFADKYQRGGKKITGGAGLPAQAGMASLSRELPAKIPTELKAKIESQAKTAYEACRCTGMARVDFMLSNNELYLTEINPIPGSMAFYLWEASGIPFRQQITDAIEEAVREHQEMQAKKLDYATDIIERFVKAA